MSVNRINVPADTPAYLKVLLWPFVTSENLAERLVGGPLNGVQMVIARVAGGALLLVLLVVGVRLIVGLVKALLILGLIALIVGMIAYAVRQSKRD